MAPSFVETNKDFVLKLKIEASNGSTQVRRIRLPRLDDGCGNVSYDELVGIAITFIFPDDGSVEEPENYRVVLSYTDVDEDVVTIASSDELVDAIEQFADVRILRISAQIRDSRKGRPKGRTSSAGSIASSASACDKAQPPAPPPVASAKIPLVREPPARHVLDAVMGVVSAAVASSQKTPEKKAPPPKNSVDEAVDEAAKLARKVAEEATKLPETKPRAPEPSAPAEPPVAAARTTETPKPETTIPVPSVSSAKAAPVKEAPKEPEKKDTELEKDESKLFIHARHTCDGCLMTPIVGKRYHATNISDYDLCAKCYSNYSGPEFQFEAVELDRDRAFQEKWRRRREKIMARSGRGGMSSGRFRGGRRFGGSHGKPTHNPFPPPPPPPHHRPHFPPPPPHHGPPKPFAPPPPPPPPHHGLPPPFGGPYPFFPNPFARPQAPAADDEDEQLKEAIRRSLRDVPKKATEDANSKVPAEGSAQEEPQEMLPAEVAGSVAYAKEAPKEETEENKTEVVVSDGTSSKEMDSVPAEEPETKTEVSLLAPVVAGIESVVDVETVSDDLSVVSDCPPETKPEAKPKRAPFSPGDMSFMSEASGNGEVAEAIGKTLDSFARVFDEILTADAPDAEDNNGDEGVKVGDVTKDGEEKSEAASIASPGAVIIDSAETEGDQPTDAPSAASSGSEGWQVVHEDGGSVVSSSSNNNDNNDIGGAAIALGSALFASDLKSSTELKDSNEVISHLSDSSCSDSFSSASSVPSTLPSLSSGAGRQADRSQRWAPQLTQLREIGFTNDERNIEIMERLEAANIGVGSTDSITVAQVINEMYRS